MNIATPGGHLDFGESPEACAARETMEETGVSVINVQFVAITNDVLADADKHYVTIWMRGEVDTVPGRIGDDGEIAEIGWFAPDALPSPLHLYFQNLISGRACHPRPQTCPSQFHPSPNHAMQPTHIYEVRPRRDHRGVNLISDALPFGRLWYGEPNAVANAISYAKFYSRSDGAVIRVVDSAGIVIETYESAGGFKEP
jgi:hypothetical protein